MLEFLFWFFVIPATLATFWSIRTGRRYLEHVQSSLQDTPGSYHPPATLIVPVKGLEHDLSQNLLTLAEQDYPDYEFILVSRSESDRGLRSAQAVLGGRARVVVAGDPPDGQGEKVHNLLVAVDEARASSEVFVFADSDGQVSSTWLRSLVAPLEDHSLGATTGFRWYFPEDGGFWPLLRSVWNSTVAGNMSSNDKNFAWGGATGIRREVFEQAELRKFWQGAVSDDYRLSSALNAAKLGICFVPGGMVASTGGCSGEEFLQWATRQLIITRVYRRGLWWAGFLSHVVYCGAMLISLLMVIAGNPLGLAGLVVTIIPGMGKGAMRCYAARLMFPDREDWLDRFGWAFFWFVPIATWAWLYIFVRSAITRKIEWRGNVYELVSADKTRLVKTGDAGNAG